jgi:hypothetical protein
MFAVPATAVLRRNPEREDSTLRSRPRESKEPGVYDWALQVLSPFSDRLDDSPAIRMLVNGGQRRNTTAEKWAP